jgi:SAM-dependent methyltransferase
MQPHQIAQSYDKLATLWNDESFPRESGIAQHERALAFLKGNGHGHALDIGCGSSGRFIELLSGNGFVVDGVDISGEMLRLARLRHPNVQFYHADICSWELPRQYDFITAWDSIWHVPLDVHPAVLRKILCGLTPGGFCIFSAGGLDVPMEKTDSAMGQPMYYSVLGIQETLRLIEQCGCVCRHLEYDQFPEQHVYFVAQRSG